MGIRLGEAKDCKAVLSIAKEVQDFHRKHRPEIFENVDPYSESFYNSMLDESDTFLYVIEKENQILGYAIATINKYSDLIMLKKRKILMIDDFCIKQSNKRQGLGSELFSYILDKAKEHKVDSLELNVWHFNVESRCFYLAMGMKEKSHEFEMLTAPL